MVPRPQTDFGKRENVDFWRPRLLPRPGPGEEKHTKQKVLRQKQRIGDNGTTISAHNREEGIGDDSARLSTSERQVCCQTHEHIVRSDGKESEQPEPVVSWVWIETLLKEGAWI